jgi:DNA recombination protein RmuC
MTDPVLVVLGATALVLVVVLAWMGLRLAALDRRVEESAGRGAERLERELRAAIAESRREAAEGSRAQREELAAAAERAGTALREQLANIAQVQNNQIDQFAQSLAAFGQGMRDDGRNGREEQSAALKRFGDTLDQRLATLAEANERKLVEVRQTLETRLKHLQDENGARLEQMRQTVDEKLHATLEQRLSESFKVVSERLEQVHRGLGEMQSLAAGVGDLKRVLTNVKMRGTWGEIQLAALLEQMLAPEQYAANVETRRGSNQRVEFAIRLPGRDDAGTVVWLPVDAKFPREDYERLMVAHERADREAVEQAEKALETCIRDAARAIRDKYVEPPGTTDFAVMFLPVEGLYAEVLRRPGLAELLQREYRITITGPTTFAALLNSLQMGFRTLAIERRSSEVWGLLGAVKTEFGKFADVLAKTRRKLDEAANTIGNAETRTRAIERKLRGVEALPAPAADTLLEVADETPAEGAEVSHIDEARPAA